MPLLSPFAQAWLYKQKQEAIHRCKCLVILIILRTGPLLTTKVLELSRDLLLYQKLTMLKVFWVMVTWIKSFM